MSVQDATVKGSGSGRVVPEHVHVIVTKSNTLEASPACPLMAHFVPRTLLLAAKRIEHWIETLLSLL